MESFDRGEGLFNRKVRKGGAEGAKTYFRISAPCPQHLLCALCGFIVIPNGLIIII